MNNTLSKYGLVKRIYSNVALLLFVVVKLININNEIDAKIGVTANSILNMTFTLASRNIH